jgi:hypothetical protein
LAAAGQLQSAEILPQGETRWRFWHVGENGFLLCSLRSRVGMTRPTKIWTGYVLRSFDCFTSFAPVQKVLRDGGNFSKTRTMT